MGIGKVKALRKAIFLDRDGVLNHAIVKEGRPFPPSSLAEVRIIEGVKKALQDLHAAGFLLIVVTNQPDVARGTMAGSVVKEINDFLKQELLLDDIFICFHDNKDKCDCRKPLPGLLLQAAKKYNIDLEKSFMVGDRWRDVEAGKNANCKAVWIDCNYDEPKPGVASDYIAKSLNGAVSWILNS